MASFARCVAGCVAACVSLALAGCAVSVSPGPRPDAAVDPTLDAGPPPPAVDRGVPPDPLCEPGSTWGNFCGHGNADASCQDGCFCNGAEFCQGGVCVAPALDACDDGIRCTEDLCDEAGESCTNIPRDELCDDGNECTGVEVCDPDVGCLPGIPLRCGDGDQCTTDLCVPGVGCTNPLRDLDQDGFADIICGGEDCDDAIDGGAEVNPAAVEVCDDGVDNNCDATVDLLDEEACPMIHDDCDSAFLLGDRQLVSFPRGDLTDDYALSCEVTDLPDAVFRFELTEEREVEIELRPAGLAVLEVRPTAFCDDDDAAVACERLGTAIDGLSFTATGRGTLPAGSYDIIAGLPGPGPYDLVLETNPPPPRPETDLCDAAAPVISASTLLTGAWAGHRDDYPSLPCGTRAAPSADVVYQLSLASASDVEISATATDVRGFASGVRFAMVRRCTDSVGSNVSCEVSDLAAGRIEVAAMPAGVYWILIEDDDPFTDPEDYSLDVTVTPVP